MILSWIQEKPSYKLMWQGPNRILLDAIVTLEEVKTKIAVITGPKGDIGPPGPKGEKGDAAVLSDITLILDGGNF